ncbi:MAG: chromate transporter [Spirochaetales bacterium]|nr:chromate transporter [Spirochaetales bacterium]
MNEEQEKKTSLWSLFITFAKVGVMTFGGGYAMLPILEREVVTNHGWATSEEMLDYYAIGQCTPGIIAVNVATFTGFKKRGFIGSVAAILGILFPSVVIITSLASVLKIFQDNVHVQKAFAGIRIAVCALIASTVINLARKTLKSIVAATITIAVFCLELFLNASPVIIVASTIAFGLIMYFATRNKKKEVEE